MIKWSLSAILGGGGVVGAKIKKIDQSLKIVITFDVKQSTYEHD